MENPPTFGLDSYHRFLDALEKGGYDIQTFEQDQGGEGVVLLRHDVDKSVERALEIAAVERERGIRASYFFLLRSRMYNLLEPETRARALTIADMGHSIGLHVDQGRISSHPHEDQRALVVSISEEIQLFEAIVGRRSSRCISFHNPSRAVVGWSPSPVDFTSTYAPRFMPPRTKYISDSNAHWREGDPIPLLGQTVWPRVQILIHPLWWTGERPVSVMQALDEAFSNRLEQINAYLVQSNDLWRQREVSGQNPFRTDQTHGP